MMSIFLVFVVVFDAFSSLVVVALIPILLMISRFFFCRLERGFQLRFRRSIGHHHHRGDDVVFAPANKVVVVVGVSFEEEFLSQLSRRARGFPHDDVLLFIPLLF